MIPNPINSELERLRFDYEEKIIWYKSQDRIAKKLLEEKIRESGLRIQTKVIDLENIEKAMLNILEDARELEDRLKNEYQRVKTIVSVIGEGLLVIDKNYKITLMNAVAEKQLEISISEAVGRDAKDVIFMFKGGQPLPDDERPVALMFKTGLPNVVAMEDNLYYKTNSGKMFPVAMVATPMRREGDIAGAVVVFRNISEEKNLDESKTGFISIASHQLRTPLTSIRWFGEMLTGGDAGPLNKDQRHFISMIQESAERMIDLVNLLLQLARVEAGRVRIDPVRTDLKALIDSVVFSLQAMLNEKEQTVEVKTSRDQLPLIPMDQEVFWQVAQNLLTNAMRYSPQKGAITVLISDKGDTLECSVKDSGIGIPERQQNRVFEKFFRADNAIKEIPEGSGLGLALVKSLVEGWGGKIWFESKEGAGTIFHFTVPVEGMKRKAGEVGLKV